MKAIIDSNQVRKDFIIKSVMEKKPKTLGIYRLAMKKDSDNFRQSAMFTIINEMKKYKIKIKIYEPELIETIDGTTLEMKNNLVIQLSGCIFFPAIQPE